MNTLKNQHIKRRKFGEIFFEKDFPLRLKIEDPQYPTLPHLHEFSEIVVVVSGEGLHKHGQTEYQIYAGDVFVVREEVPHGYAFTQDLGIINLIFDPRTLPMMRYDVENLPGYHAFYTLEPQMRSSGQSKALLHLSSEDMGTLKTMLYQMEEEIHKKKAGHRFVSMAIFMQVLAFLSRCYEKLKTPVSQEILRLGAAMSYINDNYRQEINLDDLSEISHMSISTLSRLFRQYLKHSPINYLIQVRLNRAAELLRDTDLSITEIAFDCGFRDSNYFTRMFRSNMGMTPSKYRKSHK